MTGAMLEASDAVCERRQLAYAAASVELLLWNSASSTEDAASSTARDRLVIDVSLLLDCVFRVCDGL